jgi:PAS domain S-box-containing protein
MTDIRSRSNGERTARRKPGPRRISASASTDSIFVANLSLRALTQTNLAIVMNDACELVAERLGTEFVKVLEIVPTGEGFLLTAGVGWKPGYVGQVVVPLIDESHAGYTMKLGEPVIVEDLANEKRFRGMPLLHEHGVVSGVSVIMRNADRIFGIMTAHTQQKRTFSASEVAFLDSVASVVAAAIDRKETEQALRESDERLRLAMEAGRMGTWEWDLKNGTVVWSGTLEGIHGMEPGTFPRTPVAFFEFVHPDDRDYVQRAISGALESGYHEIEYRVVLRDRSIRWLTSRGVLIKEDSDDPGRMIGVCMDITDRKVAERAILRAEEQYRAIFENAAFGVFQTTPEGRFINANRKLATILGFASTEEMVREVQDIGHQVHVDPARRAEFARLLSENREVTGFESQARRKDGRTIWISLTGRAKWGADGSVTSFEGMVEDITERKNGEARIAAQYAVTRSLAEAPTLSEALQGVLEAVATNLDWQIAQMWTVDRKSKRLVRREYFQRQDTLSSKLVWRSGEITFDPGTGLPGRVWTSRRAEWIEDLSKDANFPRAPEAAADGIRSAAAFPVILDRDVIGVIEFFSTAQRRSEKEVLELMESIGSQVGQFIERKRAEEEMADLVVQLEAARERVDNIVSNVPGVVWEAWGSPDDAEQRIDFVSDYVEEMLGYSVEEWLATPNFWLTIVHPDDRKRAAAESRAAFEAGSGTIEFRWMTKDGRAIWVEAQSTVIRDEIGTPLGMRGVTMDITERRLADAKVRESEERFSKAFHASPAGLSIVTADERRFLDVNDSFLEIIEHMREEVVGKLVDEVGVWFAPADRERFAEALEASGGHARNVEVQLRTRTGALRSVLGSAEAITLGGQTCVLSLMYDITARKQAEEALVEESQTLEALNRIGRLLSAELDLETLVQAVTDAVTAVTGARCGAFYFNHADENGLYAPYTIAGCNEFPLPPKGEIFQAVFHADGLMRVDDVAEDVRFRNAANPDLRSFLAVPVISRRGGVLGGLFLAHPRANVFEQRDERLAAGLAAQAAIAMDNAQLYEGERAARADAEAGSRRQAFLAEASAILSSSLDYHETLNSLAQMCVPYLADWCSIDLWDGEEIRRVAVVHNDPAKLEFALRLQEKYPANPHQPEVRALLEEGKPIHFPEIPEELLLRNTRSEEHRQLMKSLGARSSMAVPLKTGGRTIGILSLVSAESGRRYTERDVALARDLGERAGLAVENAMLYQRSQEIGEELRKANEAKDEFLGLVSHELRTPITTIFGGARLLRTRNDNLDEESRIGVLQDIEQESERLHRIVEDLLVLARAELGEEVQTEPILVQRMTERTVSAFNKRRPGRAFVLHLDDGLPPVRASNVYLEQILRNLMNNADKYSPPDTEIEIHARMEGDDVVVSVMDRGPGIPAEESELIFERFYRSVGTAKTAGGAGIGLTVCRRLVEAQHGRIWAEPREGGGLIVSFSLPRYEDR